jgi:hypothetical protein
MRESEQSRKLTRRDFLRRAAAGVAGAAAWPGVGRGLASVITARRAGMANEKAQTSTRIPRYGRWQGEFDPQTQAERVEFHGPDGSVVVRPTFQHLPAKLVYDDHGYETIEPSGKPVLAARMTPTEIGRYTYRAMAGDAVVAQSEFQCGPSDATLRSSETSLRSTSHPGYVQVSERDPRYSLPVGVYLSPAAAPGGSVPR